MYPQIISFWTSPNAARITVWQLSEGGYSYKLESSTGSKIINKSYDEIKLALTGRGYKESTDEQIEEGAIPLKGYGPDEYGIRWRVVKNDRQGSIVTKEKWFASDEARTKFANRLEDADGFLEILAYSNPRELDEDNRNVDNTVKMTKSAFTNKPTAAEPPAIEFDRKVGDNPYRQNREKTFGRYYRGLNQGGQVMKEGWEGNVGWHLLAPDHEVIKQLDKVNMSQLKDKYGSPNPAIGYLGYVDSLGFVIAYYDNGKTVKGQPWSLDESVETNESAPPGMEDVVMKLKKQYPNDHSKAFATAWSIYNKKHGKKSNKSLSEEAGLHPDVKPIIYNLLNQLEKDGVSFPEEYKPFWKKIRIHQDENLITVKFPVFNGAPAEFMKFNGQETGGGEQHRLTRETAKQFSNRLLTELGRNFYIEDSDVSDGRLFFVSDLKPIQKESKVIPSGRILLAIDRALAKDKKK